MKLTKTNVTNQTRRKSDVCKVDALGTDGDFIKDNSSEPREEDTPVIKIKDVVLVDGWLENILVLAQGSSHQLDQRCPRRVGGGRDRRRSPGRRVGSGCLDKTPHGRRSASGCQAKVRRSKARLCQVERAVRSANRGKRGKCFNSKTNVRFDVS